MARVEGNGCQNPYAWKWGVGAGAGMAALLAAKILWDMPQTKTFFVMEGVLGGVAGVAYWCHKHVTVIEEPRGPRSRQRSIADAVKPSDLQAHIPSGSWKRVAVALWVKVGDQEEGSKRVVNTANQALLHGALRELKAEVEGKFASVSDEKIEAVWVAAVKRSDDSLQVVTADRRMADMDGNGYSVGGRVMLKTQPKASLLIKDDIQGW